MSNQSSNKGNPASKRMSNPNKKACRSRSWARGQKRKKQRVEAQEKREMDNRQRREQGLPTPWEEAQRDRAERRDQDPEVLERRRKWNEGVL